MIWMKHDWNMIRTWMKHDQNMNETWIKKYVQLGLDFYMENGLCSHVQVMNWNNDTITDWQLKNDSVNDRLTKDNCQKTIWNKVRWQIRNDRICKCKIKTDFQMWKLIDFSKLKVTDLTNVKWWNENLQNARIFKTMKIKIFKILKMTKFNLW